MRLSRLALLVIMILLVSFLSPVRAAAESHGYDLATQHLVFATYLNNWEKPGPLSQWAAGWSFDDCGITDYPRQATNGSWTGLASVYTPLIGPYDAGDTAVMQYHIELAQASGIDVFVVDWNGINDFSDFQRINANFKTMLGVAERMNFGLAIDYDAVRYYTGDTSSGKHLIQKRSDVLTAVTNDIAYAIKEFGSSVAYLKYNGKPVIFVFGPYSLSADEWRQVMLQLSNEGLVAYYISMQADPYFLQKYFPEFQGFFPWIPAEEIMHHETTSTSYIGDTGADIRDFKVLHGVSMGLGVWPGFDDSAVGAWCGPSRGRIVQRLGGLTYNETWEEALRFHPDFVHVVTFNDWNEGTIVEPSIQFGYQYLYATAYYSAQFKHETPNYDAIPVPLAIYNATLALRQAQDGGRLVGFDAANETLTLAEEAFQAGQYSAALTYANQAQQLANQATSPQTSTIAAATESTASVRPLGIGGLQLLYSLPEWYWIFLATIVVVGVIGIIILRKRQ